MSDVKELYDEVAANKKARAKKAAVSSLANIERYIKDREADIESYEKFKKELETKWEEQDYDWFLNGNLQH